MLAGGESRRMGRDKATLTVPGWFGGRTLVEHLVGVAGECCTPLYVVAAATQRLPVLAAEVLRDPIPGLGPLPAVGLGLGAAAAAGAPLAFVCAVDTPFITAELIGALRASAVTTGADAVFASDGRDHYLCAVYRTRVADRIGALVAGGERRMRALAATLDTRRVAVAGPLRNLNTPADLRPAPLDGD